MIGEGHGPVAHSLDPPLCTGYYSDDQCAVNLTTPLVCEQSIGERESSPPTEAYDGYVKIRKNGLVSARNYVKRPGA